MMKPVTSMFDLFNRAEKDERYRRLVIAVYEDACYPPPVDKTFEKAKRWIDDWVANNVRPKANSTRNRTCCAMVEYANDRIYRIDPEHDEPDETG